MVYQERYRLTREVLPAVGGGAMFVFVGFLPTVPMAIRIVDFSLFGVVFLWIATVLVSRKVALRVDHRGITLGGHVPRYKATTGAIRWKDVNGIQLWAFDYGFGTSHYIRVVRRQGSPRLPSGLGYNRLGRTVLGSDFAANRQILLWSLDADRLREVVAQLAPDVLVTGANIAHRSSIEVPWLIRWIWRLGTPLVTGLLLAVLLLRAGDDWRAHLGYGTPGTWTETSVHCHGSCTYQGRFVSADHHEIRENVVIGSGVQVSEQTWGLPTVEVGGRVYPTGGGQDWIESSVMSVLCVGVLVTWIWTVPVRLLLTRPRRPGARPAR